MLSAYATYSVYRCAARIAFLLPFYSKTLKKGMAYESPKVSVQPNYLIDNNSHINTCAAVGLGDVVDKIIDLVDILDL